MKKTARQSRSIDSPGSKLNYKAQGPTLDTFHRRQDYVRGLIGPLGSGKTIACINELLMAIHHQVPDRDHIRRSRWVIARNSFPDLYSATIPDFRSITDRLPFGEFKNGSPPSWECGYLRKDGTRVKATVLFRSFDGDDDVKKARGLQLSGVWIDELGEFHKANFDMLMGRVGRWPPKNMVPKSRSMVLFSSNATARDHWLAELAFNQPEGWWIGIQPGGVIRQGGQWVQNAASENLMNLPDNYYLKQIGGKKESWIRQNLANEFVFHNDGRSVHPDFNEALHGAGFELLATPAIALHVGIDFGRTPAAVIMQRQPSGQWYILDELTTTNTSALSFGKALRRFLNERYANFEVIATGDPSGDSMAQTRDETPIDMINLAGVDCFPASSNDFETRITVLDSLLTQIVDGQPALLVSRRCPVLTRGLSGAYQYRRVRLNNLERYHDKPDKGPESHVCEALHYGLMGAGEGDNLFTQAYDTLFDDIDSWAPPVRQFE